MNCFTVAVAALVLAAKAEAASVVALPNQELPLGIHASLGSIIQLPTPVKTVTPAQYFVIQELGGGESKSDVRTLHIKPVSGAGSEVITLVLASGRAVALKLMATPGGEKYYEVGLQTAAPRSRDAKFLSNELAMMRAMLLDESGGFARERIAEGGQVATIDDGVELTLARIYAAADLTGYVFTVENRSGAALDLKLPTLSMPKPQRLVLAQVDGLRLEACPTLAAPTSACQTALRLVVRGPKPERPLVSGLANKTPPFTKAKTEGVLP